MKKSEFLSVDSFFLFLIVWNPIRILNTDPIWIQIHNTGYQGFENC